MLVSLLLLMSLTPAYLLLILFSLLLIGLPFLLLMQLLSSLPQSLSESLQFKCHILIHSSSLKLVNGRQLFAPLSQNSIATFLSCIHKQLTLIFPLFHFLFFDSCQCPRPSFFSNMQMPDQLPKPTIVSNQALQTLSWTWSKLMVYLLRSF